MKQSEILAEIRDKLLAQGERSEFNDSCRYRGQDGFRCAIGHRIPDDLYTPEIEGAGYTDLPQPIRDAVGLTDRNGRDAQTIHDAILVSEWEHNFNRLIDRAKAEEATL